MIVVVVLEDLIALISSSVDEAGVSVGSMTTVVELTLKIDDDI